MKPQTIAVDFDGVIANYDGWSEGEIGDPRVDVNQVLKTLRAEGWKIIVFSCRAREEIEPYLVANAIPFDEINPMSGSGSKPLATVYWDDRAYRYSGNAFDDLDHLRTFRTWSGRT